MFMVYIRFNGKPIGQKVVWARSLDHAIANVKFEYIACNNIPFEDAHLVDIWGHQIFD